MLGLEENGWLRSKVVSDDYELLGQDVDLAGPVNDGGAHSPRARYRPTPMRGSLPSNPVAAAVLALALFALGFWSASIRTTTTGLGTASPATRFPSVRDPVDKTADSSVFDALRALPAVDLLADFGLDPRRLTRYPPLGKQICIANVDTREWAPGTIMNETDYNSWGFFNHYMYAQFHGYTFKHIKAPVQDGLHPTWVKVKEQFLLTMQDECKFVLMLDADTVFKDIRVPFEILLSHWNVTDDVALLGGLDYPGGVNDDRGNTLLNTGFILTQKHKVLPNLMRDWALCPTEVKYEGCAKWKMDYFHEQSAISNYIRYDEDYAKHIVQLTAEEVHWPGTFVRHYWGPDKSEMPMAAKGAILDRIIPHVLSEMQHGWTELHEHREKEDYDYLLETG